MVAFLLNAVALILTIIAAVGLTTDPQTLQLAPWIKGNCFIDERTRDVAAHVYIGVNMRYDIVNCATLDPSLQAPCQARMVTRRFKKIDGRYEKAINWVDEDACDYPPVLATNGSVMFEEDITQRELCEHCKDNLLPAYSVILSIISQLPTMTTNLQRTTLFGDANCQKTMGIVTNIVTLITSMIALLEFRRACYVAIVNSTNAGMPESIVVFDVEWEMGLGFRCLMIATIIKVFDAASHVFVPSPRGKQTKPVKKPLTLPEYLHRGNLSPFPTDSPDPMEMASASDKTEDGEKERRDGQEETRKSVEQETTKEDTAKSVVQETTKEETKEKTAEETVESI
jgi:hypothetical protein